eukprot:NODE_738_length_4687_cov_0.308849.p4 type:complete len:141 gc:universal NODE_738_length_4687_cov_0.308849:3944-3522(-)
MQEQCPGTEIIKDVGSGVHFKRRGFARLLKLVQENLVERSRLQTKIDSAASDMNYLKMSVDIMERKSWFSMRSKMTPIESSLTTYLPSVMSLLQPKMDKVQQETKKKEQKRFGKIVKSKTDTIKCCKSVQLCLDAEHRAL